MRASEKPRQLHQVPIQELRNSIRAEVTRVYHVYTDCISDLSYYDIDEIKKTVAMEVEKFIRINKTRGPVEEIIYWLIIIAFNSLLPQWSYKKRQKSDEPLITKEKLNKKIAGIRT